MTRYADIVLPLSQPAYTFEVDQALGVAQGDAVVVPFGARRDKFYTGIVWRIHDERPPFKRIKRVVSRLYSRPLLNASQRKFWEWVASYYMCSVGEVMRVALPSMMKPQGSSEAEFRLDEYRPREEYYVTCSESLRDEQVRCEVLDKIERRAPKQYEAMLEILQSGLELIPRRLLEADIATLHTLARKGHILLEKRECTTEQVTTNNFQLPTLTPHQAEALDNIRQSFTLKSTTLLRGVTGSGKSEIYMHLIAERLTAGDDVLLLLPEIALTSQLIERMERIFGARVVAYHSKLSESKRTEVYLQLNNREGGNFVIGVRSAIFLPLKRLKLIVVDEEHDPSYKQSDPAPRYNARDCAVAIASMQGANTLLGSATPSLETWSNAQSGKYGLATLTERYGDAQLPQITISDTIRSVKRGERRGHFNFDLLNAIKDRLSRGEQTILFQNRRGFAPYIECSECGWSARCPHCNVTLTMHKGANRLSCHYCGYTEPLAERCPTCHNSALRPMGFGTEKIEEQLCELIPEAKVARLDRDSVTSSRALSEIVSGFESGKSNILVGTQMVTKGFDFSKVTLVGVLNADNMLNSPDFRAEERAFQLMMQVAGRAGRRDTKGEVIIQSSQPEHRMLRFVGDGDYDSMASTLLAEREMFHYPPYGRIVAITMRDKDQNRLNRAANHLSASLRPLFGRRLQGPVAPAVDKIRDEYIVALNLKVEAGASSGRARAILSEHISALREIAEFKYITIICNVDPQ